jgi:hypothetical protein
MGREAKAALNHDWGSHNGAKFGFSVAFQNKEIQHFQGLFGFVWQFR